MRTQTMAFPRATDRPAWARVDDRVRAQIRSAGEALFPGEYPMLTAAQYMAFVRDGSREAFQVPYFARRDRLLRAALAECEADDGRYVDTVTDGLWCLCEESSWCISAHNDPGLPLPDTRHPIIDLFAAQTASLVSWVCYLLEDRLPPMVVERAERECRARVLAPFLARDDFWWMGITRTDLCNWTPWILANVLGTAHIWGEDVDARAEVMLGRWLACIPEDGGLDEGAAYWNMAGGSLLDCLEHLGANRYGEAKIRNLAAFPVRAHIAGEYFINFADCDAKPHLDGERLYTFGLRTGNAALSALGAEIAARAPALFPGDTPEFYRTLCALFHPVEAPAAAVPAPDAIDLPSLSLWIRRRGGWFVALKGGHNGDSHNHNDVGSLIVYLDGEPAIVDAGNMVYTAKTFRDETRYTLWNTRSANHSVPLIGGIEQAAGAAYRARDARLDAKRASMDIAGAYPEEAGVERLLRALSLEPDGLCLTDTVVLRDAKPVTWVFLLREAPTLSPGLARAGKLAIRFDTALAADCEVYPVTDARMARNYPGVIYRLTITAGAAARHEARFRLNREDEHNASVG